MNWILDNIGLIIGFLSSGTAGSLITHFTLKKTRNSKIELTDSESELVHTTVNEKIGKVYSKMIQDVDEKIDNFTLKIKGLEENIEDLRQENRIQRKTITILQNDNTSLHRKILKLSVENTELTTEVYKLKQINKELKK